MSDATNELTGSKFQNMNTLIGKVFIEITHIEISFHSGDKFWFNSFIDELLPIKILKPWMIFDIFFTLSANSLFWIFFE